MRRESTRGSALVSSMTVLTVVFILGSGILSLSMQSARRGRFDVLRTRAYSLAEAGVEKALSYLRTRAPDGSINGGWRTASRTETVDTTSDYTFSVVDGTAENSGKVVVTSTGRAMEGGLTARRSVRVVVKITEEDVSIWNNAIFGGVGQAGKSINGNVVIRGGIHLLGDGESFTDSDGDGRWDAGEVYTDSNRNGQYDVGESYADADGDGHWDAREPFEDTNGNATRDPALTVTDLSSELGGDANIGNNYAGMPSNLRSLLPNPPTTRFQGENVETLNAKVRVKHGRVDLSGSATVGDPQVAGGSPPMKESMDGAYVSDGFGGTAGVSQVYSDNGTRKNYDLGDGVVEFPSLTEPTVKSGVRYNTYMDYLSAVGMRITGNLTLTPGVAYSRTDAYGNALIVDTLGNITIRGIVYVDGDIRLERDGGNRGMTYVGRGTLVSTGSIYVGTNIVPAAPTFPTTNAMGFIARRRVELGTGGGDSQLTLAGAFYAQEQIISQKQNELAGTFVSSYFSMQNVPHMYQVPLLTTNLPPGMPGSDRILIKTVRIDSWREVGPA